jgi:hypothetical protein
MNQRRSEPGRVPVTKCGECGLSKEEQTCMDDQEITEVRFQTCLIDYLYEIFIAPFKFYRPKIQHNLQMVYEKGWFSMRGVVK